MNIQRSILAAAVAAVLGACSGGEVNLNVATVDNSVDNSTTTGGGGQSNPCASYTVTGSNEVRQGQFDGRNCVYNSQFVGITSPLAQDVTIPFISGVHIFQDSLVIGRNVASGAAAASGTGPKLTIAAGNTLAFSDSADYVLVNRGSQLLAVGSPAAPITFTSFSDAVSNNAGANDVSQWGGIVINGNALTNNCTADQAANNQCHVVSEGQPSNYGGNNTADNSGILRHVVVKHTGFEVAPGDELNGITFNAVGNGTVVENVQVYSTFDDGFEFFGGSVNLKNVVALYARDDSLDFSDGYSGTIENALIIQWQTDGQQCIELDGIGETRFGQNPAAAETPPLTTPTVRNMTCIMSAFRGGTHGNSEGVRVRRGGRLTLANSIIAMNYGLVPNPSGSVNVCWRIESAQTQASAVAGTTQVDTTITACPTIGTGTVDGTNSVTNWVAGTGFPNNAGNTNIIAPTAAGVVLFEPGTFYTAQAPNSGSAAITVPTGGFGAVRRFGANSDWTAPWAFGLRAQNADQPLWFAP